MAPQEVYLGRRITTTPDPQYGIISAGVMRAGVFDAPTEPVWVDEIYMRMGKSGATNANARLMLYDAQDGLDELLGYGGLLTLNVQMATAAGGENKGGAVSVSNNGYNNQSILLLPGRAWGIAVGATTAAIAHGMAVTGVSGNLNFYDQLYGGTPPEAFGNLPGANEGKISGWVHGWTNEAPRVPVDRVPSVVTSDTTPTFTSTFRDRNGNWGTANDGHDSGDYLSKAKLEVRDYITKANVWTKTYNATAWEKANDTQSYTYDGPTLALGRQLEWRVTHWDGAGVASTVSDWLAVTIASAGVVNDVTVGAVSGKLSDTTPDISARYTHAQGYTGTHAQFIVRQGSPSGTIVATSAEINITDVASSASPGTLFTTTWATTGLPTLSWETTYYIGVRVKDSNSVWTDYRYAAAARTNVAPSVPSNLLPGNVTITTLPVLVSFGMTDADDAAADLTGRVLIEGAHTVTNGAFASNITGWTGAATAGITRTTAYDGTLGRAALGSAKINVTANSAGVGATASILSDAYYPVARSQVQTVRASVYSTNTNIRPRIFVNWYTAANVLISSSEQTPPALTGAGVWHDYVFTTGAAPATATKMKVGVAAYMNTAGALGAVNIDDILIDRGAQFVVDATYNSSTALYEVSLTSAEIPAIGVWSISAYGYDDILYSGGTESEALAAKSLEADINYITGPSVSITSHTNGQTITTVSPPVTYVAPTQVRRNVEILDQATGEVLRRSGWQITSSTSYTPSPGYIHQGDTIIIRVTVEDVNLIQATAQVSSIVVDIPPPPTLTGFTLEPVALNNEAQETALLATWNETTVTEGWLHYTVYLRGLGRPLAKITPESTTEYLYAHPRSGQSYEIGVSQTILVDNVDDIGEEVESDILWLSNSVVFGGVILTNADNPLGERFFSEAWAERGYERTGIGSDYDTWEEEAPFTINTSQTWKRWAFVTPLANYDDVIAADQEAAAESIHQVGTPICYRDGYARKDFVSVPRDGGMKVSDGRNELRTVTWRARTVAYNEGIGEDQ
jgi:hypothetical protein